MRDRLVALIGVLLLSLPVAAGGPGAAPAPGRGSVVPVVELRGDVVAGGQLRLYIRPGAAATRSLRIFSEPSHTLLAVVIDREFAEQPDGRAQVEEQKGAAVVVTDLPEGQPVLQLGGRPAGDDRVAVYVTGDSGQERLAADARVGTGAFHFSTGFAHDGTKSGGGFHHCCLGGPCTEMCTDCSTPAFTCCLTDGCCDIFCGWAGTCCP